MKSRSCDVESTITWGPDAGRDGTEGRRIGTRLNFSHPDSHCRPRSLTGSALAGSRAVPPVGTFTPPRSCGCGGARAPYLCRDYRTCGAAPCQGNRRSNGLWSGSPADIVACFVPSGGVVNPLDVFCAVAGSCWRVLR